MNALLEKLYFRLFLWSGAKLFPYVSIYAPDGDNGPVQVIHFALDEATLEKSCRELVKDGP